MRNLLKYLKNYRRECVFAPLLKLVEVVFELLVPMIVSQIVDDGVNGGLGPGYIAARCVVLVVLAALGFGVSVLAQRLAARAATGFSKELRADLFRKIQSLSYSDLDRAGASGLITRMTSDVNQIQTGVNMVLRLFLRSPIIVLGAMIIAFLISVTAGIVFAVAIVVLFAVVFVILTVNVRRYREVQSELDDITLATHETLTGSRVVRAFCKEDEEIRGYREKNDRMYEAQRAAGRVSALLNPLTFAIMNVAIIVLLYVSGLSFDAGGLTQGEVVALYNYMALILAELIKFSNLVMTVAKSTACAGRVSEILAMEPSLVHEPYSKRDGESPFVRFDGVSVRYGHGAEYALSDVSFSVERGQTVGIIGGTGSGKTTLVNLIPHFYDATEGTVEIDGVNVNAYGDKEVRAMCGIVPQKATLFTGTIRDNIRWGADATDEEILRALDIAQATDIIESKEHGLDEHVEQGGSNFSGGQRQRLAIARALVRKPSILILDDSTSALDYATEAAFRRALKSLDYEPATFIVSQRTSALRGADKIIVLDGGRVAGIGTHEELLENCPLYGEIHYSQVERGDAA